MSDLQERIYTHWFPPEQAESKQTVVIFKLFRNGKISNLHILHSSGNNEIDKAALNAVTNAEPFAALPRTFKEKMADVEFTFDYNVFHKHKKSLENKAK
jgi:periplasmic protein TonB